MKAMAINSWQRVFESSLSKESGAALSLPMKRGTGYAKLSKLDHGAAVYGVWIALLQVALGCVPRGTLIYTDGTGVKAHDDESLSLVTGFGLRDVSAALAALIDIGWLEYVEILTENPQFNLPSRKESLEDLLKSVGARLTYGGESLMDEWHNAVKGLGPKKVRKVFDDTTPGISMPSAFVRARKAMNL